MTAINAPRLLSPATRFERFLLRTAAQLDHVVLVRLERRAARTASSRMSAPASALDVRGHAIMLSPIANQLR